MLSLTIVILLLFVAGRVHARRRRLLRTSSDIDCLRGPKSTSWLAGNLAELYQEESGRAQLRWAKDFGGVVRCHGPLGVPFLAISDRSAMHHILANANGTRYEQSIVGRHRALFWGRNLLAASNEEHARHRKALQSVFTPGRTKNMHRAMMSASMKMVKIWEGLLSEGNSRELDVVDWMHRLSFDTLAEACFSLPVNSLENGDEPTLRAYSKLLENAFANRSPFYIFAREGQHRLPRLLAPLLALLDPKRARSRIRTARLTRGFTETITSRRLKGLRNDDTDDMLDALIQANDNEDPKAKLSDEEVAGNVGVFLLAGHDTTSVTMVWTLHELALEPRVQAALRKEIYEMNERLIAEGEEWTAESYDKLPYLGAVVRECLRLHPSLATVRREALNDDLLQLSTPVKSVDGDDIHRVAIPSGTVVELDIISANRDPRVWGDDADTFRPERWLDRDRIPKANAASLYSGLLTFAAGPRGCMGWRFAVLEMQVFLVTLVRSFEFLPVSGLEVRKHLQLVNAPRVVGQEGRGSYLPLRILRAP